MRDEEINIKSAGPQPGITLRERSWLLGEWNRMPRVLTYLRRTSLMTPIRNQRCIAAAAWKYLTAQKMLEAAISQRPYFTIGKD